MGGLGRGVLQSFYTESGNRNDLLGFIHHLGRSRNGIWVVRAERYWLSRRNRERGTTWDRFNQLLGKYPLPAAIAIH